MRGEFYESLYRKIFRSKIIDGNSKSFFIQWQDWVVQDIITYVICFWNFGEDQAWINSHRFTLFSTGLQSWVIKDCLDLYLLIMGTEKFSDWCDWNIFRDSLITILLTSGMSLLARNRARNVSGKSILSSVWTQRINAADPTIFFVELWTFGWKNG